MFPLPTTTPTPATSTHRLTAVNCRNKNLTLSCNFGQWNLIHPEETLTRALGARKADDISLAICEVLFTWAPKLAGRVWTTTECVRTAPTNKADRVRALLPQKEDTYRVGVGQNKKEEMKRRCLHLPLPSPPPLHSPPNPPPCRLGDRLTSQNVRFWNIRCTVNS